MLDGIITVTVYFISYSNRYVYKKSLNFFVSIVLIILLLPAWQKFQLIIYVKYLEVWLTCLLRLYLLDFFKLLFFAITENCIHKHIQNGMIKPIYQQPSTHDQSYLIHPTLHSDIILKQVAAIISFVNFFVKDLSVTIITPK